MEVLPELHVPARRAIRRAEVAVVVSRVLALIAAASPSGAEWEGAR